MERDYYSKELVRFKDNASEHFTREHLFTSEECKKIIDLQSQLNLIHSEMAWGEKSEFKRDTDIYWLFPENNTLWIFDRILKCVSEINNNYFQYVLDGKVRAFQLGKYSKSQGYDWHQDMGRDLISRRKLTISVQLSDPGDYTGGELQFFKSEGEPAIGSKEIGSLTIFPTWMLHRVTRISKGTRWSLVNWLEGPPFV